MSEFDEVDSFFGGAPSFSFKAQSWRGVPRGGLITTAPRKEQQRNFDSGEREWWDKEQTQPKEHIVVTIDTKAGKYPEIDPARPGDDGVRRLFIKGQMIEALRTAFRAAGAPGLRIGGTLYVAWTGEEPAKNAKLNDKKIYTAQYFPPAPGAETDSVFGQTPAATSAPTAPAQQASTPTPAQQPDFAAATSTPPPPAAAAQPDPFATTPTVAAQAAAPNPFA